MIVEILFKWLFIVVSCWFVMEQINSLQKFNMFLYPLYHLAINRVGKLFVLFVPLEKHHQRKVFFVLIDANSLLFASFQVAP
jgi:hypothetical protein